MTMTFNEYQNKAALFAIYPGRMGLSTNDDLDGVYYTALGLAGEGGELFEKVIGRRGIDAIVGEMGDFLWFISQAAMELDCTMGFLAALEPKKHVNVDESLSFVIHAGRYCEIIKKCMRDNHSHVSKKTRQELLYCLTGCLYSLRVLAVKNNIHLTDVMDANLEKLHSRKERGVLHGNGDNR